MEKEEAMKILKDFHDKSALFSVKTALDTVFPELAESEDERIRKALIDYLDDANKADENPLQSYGIHTDKAIDWLEKQVEKPQDKTALEAWRDMRLEVYQQASGNRHEPNYSDDTTKMFSLNDIDEIIEKISEQKSADKVEPKFKVGDWITNGNAINHISKIRDDGFYCFDYGPTSDMIQYIDNTYHLWTIADAEDGDVLACEDGWTCIFKSLNDGDTFGSYCFMDSTKWFCKKGSECHTLNTEYMKAYHGEIKPATEEQRGLLFAKMKEAGYEWDAENKELKKIEKQDKQESKWTDEDGYNLQCCIAKAERDIANGCIGRNKELIE